MSMISFAFIFAGSVSFAIGYLHLIIFLRRKELRVDLVFSLMAFAIALSSFLEIWAFKTGSLSEHIMIHKATLFAQGLLWINFAWFVFYYTKSSKRWPSVLISLLYSLAVIINFFSSCRHPVSGKSRVDVLFTCFGRIFLSSQRRCQPFENYW